MYFIGWAHELKILPDPKSLPFCVRLRRPLLTISKAELGCPNFSTNKEGKELAYKLVTGAAPVIKDGKKKL